MISKRIKQLINKFNQFNIEGYIIPKNDEFFSEYAAINRLKIISNFSGSAGLAIVLRKNNYLFVDGRYTIQDRKSTRLNSSHVVISYAVFCLKKKTHHRSMCNS